MQIILLSGGSGKRLWPLSNNTRSKQFIKLLTAPDGSKESMVQRVVRQLREAGICDPITGAPGYFPCYCSCKLVFGLRTEMPRR